MDDATATRLAAALRDGDRDSFRVLVESLTRSLIAMAYRYTRDWESARDLCQETWIRVHERIGSYDPRRPFRPWLLTLHRNACLSWLRRVSRRREHRADEDELRRLSPPDANPGPEAALEEQEFGSLLREAAAGLPDRQREVFLRIDLEQGDRRQTAAELGIDATTLRTTLHLARRKVAEAIRRKEEGP